MFCAQPEVIQHLGPYFRSTVDSYTYFKAKQYKLRAELPQRALQQRIEAAPSVGMNYSTLVNELEILVKPACKVATTQKISLFDEMRAFNKATISDVLFALIPFASLIHLSDLTVNICKPAADYLPGFTGK